MKKNDLKRLYIVRLHLYSIFKMTIITGMGDRSAVVRLGAVGEGRCGCKGAAGGRPLW